MVIVNLLGQVCTLGRAPRTKETLPDFREWCRVTRHSRVFRGLTCCSKSRIKEKNNNNYCRLHRLIGYKIYK